MARLLVKRLMCVLAVALISFGGAAQAQLSDQIFAGGFSNPADGPYNDAEAARFLTQATFGPTKAEVARLRGMGYKAWINEQLALPPTLSLPWLQQLVANPNFVKNSGHRVDRFYVQASTAPDQLRQRLAFALGQIIVVSDSGGIEDLKMTSFVDLITTEAFGNYRTLLGKATFHPAMAEWLTYLRNRAAYNVGVAPNVSSILPDENYAREVMQLFSFGLVKRNLDFSLVGGAAQPTYDNAVIANLAKVFTGLTYANSPSYGNGTNGSMTDLWCLPMNLPASTAYLATGSTYHDLTAKTIFDAITLPAVATNTRASCEADINGALDKIFTHSTVAPFVSHQLIQRFVTSNPSPAYIQRVATVFSDNGSGVSGDLTAVIRAILLDDEARNPPAANFGKLREPILRMTAAWRGLDVQLGQPEPALLADGVTINTNVGNVTMTLGFDGSFNQRPWSAPSVFNFYRPDYQAPGPIDNANLNSPEFQILNESSVARMNNLIRSRAVDWFVGAANMQAVWPLVNIDSLTAIINPASAQTYSNLVDELNYRLMYGKMSPFMRSTLINLLVTQPLIASTDEPGRRDRVRQVLRVMLASPEFAVQK
jgi:uncharacterized protein (DUF1800 family)